jgi:hypothetical protein
MLRFFSMLTQQSINNLITEQKSRKQYIIIIIFISAIIINRPLFAVGYCVLLLNTPV